MTALTRIVSGLAGGLALALALVSPVAAGTIEVGARDVASADPTSIVWTARVTASAGLATADLNYRVYNPDGNVSGTIHVEVPPGTLLDLTATLVTRNAERYIPVGTRFAYWWDLTDKDGVNVTTEEEEFIFLDGRYQWQSQTIELPGAEPAPAAPPAQPPPTQPSPQPAPEAGPVPYTIVVGDYLWRIARDHGTTLEEILAEPRNVPRSGNPDLIYPGEVFYIPAPPGDAPSAAPTSPQPPPSAGSTPASADELADRGGVTVYWYGGAEGPANQAVAAAADAIHDNEALLGVTLPYPITLVIWRNEAEGELAQSPRASSFDSQVITGGTRVGTDLVHIYDALGFFVDVVRHEVAHIVTKVAGDGPFTRIPSWLDEGTAVYAQTAPGPGYESGVDRAVSTNTTMRLREMQAPSNRAELVDLFYGQSWSTVKFMIEEFGRDKFAEVYAVVKGGEPIDRALERVYGVDQDGLYNLWRKSVGLPEVQFSRVESTAVPQAEATRAPLGIPSGSSSAATATPAAGGAPQSAPTTAAEASGASSSNAMTAVIIGLVTLVVAGGLAGVGYRLMRSNR